MVHGFNHDPATPRRSAERVPDGCFTIWRQHLGAHNPEPFNWYSGVSGFGVWRAWLAGQPTSYAWAYSKLAENAARRLVAEIMDQGPGVDVICHSLGSRVVLLAMQARPNLFRRVIFLNAAETAQVALPILAANERTQFLNIAVQTDDVLDKLGAWFEPMIGKHACLGNGALAGRKKDMPGNLCQVILDDTYDQLAFADMGWDIRGDNPETYGDHHYSYLHDENWLLYRYFLDNGKLPVDLI